MPALKKYPPELKERAMRLVLDARDEAVGRRGACTRIGQQLGIPTDTLRGWVHRAEIDDRRLVASTQILALASRCGRDRGCILARRRAAARPRSGTARCGLRTRPSNPQDLVSKVEHGGADNGRYRTKLSGHFPHFSDLDTVAGRPTRSAHRLSARRPRCVALSERHRQHDARRGSTREQLPHHAPRLQTAVMQRLLHRRQAATE